MESSTWDWGLCVRLTGDNPDIVKFTDVSHKVQTVRDFRLSSFTSVPKTQGIRANNPQLGNYLNSLQFVLWQRRLVGRGAALRTEFRSTSNLRKPGTRQGNTLRVLLGPRSRVLQNALIPR